MASCKECFHRDICDKLRSIECCLDKPCSLYLNKADVRKVIYGEWVGRHGLGGYDDYRCSVCGMYEEGTRNPNLLGKYCSYCGAILRADFEPFSKWKFWDGWISNYDKRIEDATCSKCGYKHPTVRREPGSNETAQDVLNKLSDHCPGCGTKMQKEKVLC